MVEIISHTIVNSKIDPDSDERYNYMRSELFVLVEANGSLHTFQRSKKGACELLFRRFERSEKEKHEACVAYLLKNQPNTP